jgi:hypothetical protein
MVDSSKLRWCGYLISLNGNRKPRDLWERGVGGCGKRKGGDRMGEEFVKGVEGQCYNQAFFGWGGLTPGIFSCGVQLNQLRTEGRENRDLGAVTP